MSSFNPDIHVPGVWRCAKCGFRLMQSNLNAADGTVTARDDAGDKCPNDGAPLWRVTWREEFVDLVKQADPLILRQHFIHRITEEEGATVTLTGRNPDFNGLPDFAVGVTASFTNWTERLFRGATEVDCLRDAEQIKARFEGRS